MTEFDNIESINNNIEELKSLIGDVKAYTMSSEDCNNQFYSVIQALDGIVTTLDDLERQKSEPSDEYTILQTNLLEIRKEFSKLNQSIENTIDNDLKDIMSKFTEKVNRLEILNNNKGIDTQVIMNITGEVEKNISLQLKEVSDVIYSQNNSTSESVKSGFEGVNSNLRESVEYLEKSYNTVSQNVIQHVFDDLTALSTTLEKGNDNLKRSIVDLFTKIQEEIEKGFAEKIKVVSKSSGKNDSQDYEMLKNGIYNLNSNTEERFRTLSDLVSELDIYKKLEEFSKLKDLPAIGDLKTSLEGNLNRIIDEYSHTLQTSQSREELSLATQELRKGVYDELISMLSNVSEYVVENESDVMREKDAQLENCANKLESFSEKIDELTSVTELNNSGYDNVQIELNDLRDRTIEILETIKNSKKSDDSLNEIKLNVEEIKLKSESIKSQTSEISDVVKECTNSLIEYSEPVNNSIQSLLSDIKKNISILQSGDEETDYTYSMQDIEADVAKIRIYLNELTQNGINVNSEEFTDELNSVVVMVDSMKQQLNKIDECDLSDTISKLQEDVTSISTRVNRLLLSSDNANAMIETSLKEFKVLSEEIDEQIKQMASSSRLKNVEDGISELKKSLNDANSYNSVINQSLIMLAEWVDNAGETLVNISEKLGNLDEIHEVKSAVESIEIPTQVDYAPSFEELSQKILAQSEQIERQELMLSKLDEKLSSVLEENERLLAQEERLNKLDEKLTTVLELSAKNDTFAIVSKMDEIDTKLERLNKSIERITSYVDEE
jgi:DNA repair exonuclease SbcCD ATPase subunit